MDTSSERTMACHHIAATQYHPQLCPGVQTEIDRILQVGKSSSCPTIRLPPRWPPPSESQAKIFVEWPFSECWGGEEGQGCHVQSWQDHRGAFQGRTLILSKDVKFSTLKSHSAEVKS